MKGPDNYFVATVILWAFSWLTPANIDLGIKVVTCVGGLATAIVAFRFYLINTRKAKLEIKKMQEDMKKSK